jgi:putative flippase GtrA
VKITIEFLKYVTVAVLAAASDWAVFTALLSILGVPIAAQATSRIVGGLVSFGINKYWSFESGQSDRTLIEARRFIVLFVMSYLLSLSLFSSMSFSGLGPYWAKLITDASCFVFNFFMMRFWVYRPERDAGRAEAVGARPATPVSDRAVLCQIQAEPHGPGQYRGRTRRRADPRPF